MRKLMLFFAALMLTLGVKAQSSSDYFDFPSEVIKMTKLTSADQLKDGMQIVIQHNHENYATTTNHGKYFIINSAVASGSSYHTTALNSFCSGLAIFRLEGSVEQGFKLKTIHSETDGVTCYVGRFGYANLTTSALYPAVVMFEYNAEKGFRLTSMTEKGYSYCLCVDGEGDDANITTDSSERSTSDDFINRTSFNVYKVEETFGTTHYVEDAKVSLVGPAGNAIETTHTGWSDFYEFVINDGGHYGCTLLNTKYYSETNEIIAGIKYPFAISGDVAKVPVHLCPIGSGSDFEPRQEPSRISIVDGQLTIVQKPDGGWVMDKRNQWYIFPKYENMAITYAIQNVETKQYISHTSNDGTISLSETPAYFTLSANSAKTRLRFGFNITSNSGAKYTYLLYKNGSSIAAGDMGWSSSSNFLVSTVSGDELEGVEADGFVRRYHNDAFFWDGGQVDLHRAPYAMKALFESADHEDYANGEHQLYTAETGIKVTKMDTVEVTFHTYGGSDNMLLICGVDVVNLSGVVVASDYHLGKAGYDNQAQAEVNDLNVYTLPNVPMGDYTLRYWVCNRVDDSVDHGHSLLKNKGWIDVTGANYRVIFSQPLVDGKFAANTTWFRMRLHDELQRYISAQPAYMDNANKLKLTNNTPPNDYAGLWAVIGNATDGYKFYNRAWGPEYALTTTDYQEGDGGSARTYLVPVAEASVYDIVQVPGSYQFSVKLRVDDTDNAYFNYRDGYLGIWDSQGALGEENSIMTFETVNMEVFEANTVALKNKLIANWNPWVGNSKVSDFVNQISGNFVELMMKRNDFSILDGKVFKFVTKADDEDRRGRVLRVDANNNMAGVVSQGETIDDFLQIVDNGDGTFKLLHLATNKYFQTPDAHTITENAEDAAAYSYKVYGDEVQALCFISGNEMMHLGNWGYDYTTTHYNDITAGASRWDVICETDAQELSDLITKAKVLYTATQEPAYQANVGVPGYANAKSTTALNEALNGLAGKTFDKAETELTNAMTAVTDAEKEVFFPTKCYFTITNRNQSVIFDENYTSENCNDDYLWCTTSVDATNPNHLWGFYYDEVTGEYYLYNVGKALFANSKGKGEYGDTWIFSSAPVAITMEAMDTPYFHIKGDGKTMSVSEGYVGPVITYNAAGDKGIPMQFKKGAVKFDEELLEQLEGLNAMQLKPGFYTLSCGDGLYLNDDVVVGDNMRSLTALTSDKIKNIFYLTEDQELVGYASGYGFTYANCNTGKPEEGYNTFTFSKASEEGKYLVKAEDGKSVYGWADRYLTAKDGKLVVNDGVKKDATAWTIEEVTKLPVKLTHASKNRGAYGTIYSPVALKIADGIRAYTGYVTTEDGENVLVLEEFTGVIPANTGAVLWKSDATANVVVNFEITAAAGGVSEDNKLVGWVFTKANPDKTNGAYYSLGKKDDLMAFYNYTGANLSGFRARIAKNEQTMATKSLRMRFQETTAIEEIISTLQNNEVYDLNGRRVMTPAKGLYIVNGKKVFIK